MIKVSDLSFEYIKGLKVLNGVKFEFEKGMFYAICGPNGSGKTTFIKIMAGIYKDYFGSVRIKKENFYTDLKLIDELELSKLISYVPGDISIYFDFYVKDLLLMGRRRFHSFFSFYNEYDTDAAYKLAKTMGIAHLFNRRINEISNGERQMVLIAQAKLQDTDIILIDEPTSHLDIKHKIQILNELKKETTLNQKTVIAVMHDLKIASYFSNQMIFLKNGSIYFELESNKFMDNIDKISNIYDITEDEMKRFL